MKKIYFKIRGMVEGGFLNSFINVKNIKNQAGFTLTEVLVAMMILTIAIVTATNILVGILQTNKNIVKIEQAHYLAIEGLEAVRNIRDTNWLNNVDFKGRSDLLGVLDSGEYVVGLRSMGWKNSIRDNVSDLMRYKTWDLFLKSADNDKLCVLEEDGKTFYSLCSGLSDKESGFSRVLRIEPYCEDIGKSLCENSFKATSIVTFRDGSTEKKVELSSVLTNWKGGAM
jgi:prepilin-type N-terminal cleavage/methylation domain-containing protein